jgi:hypothetical protein
VQIPLIKGIATNGANVGFEADLFLAADKLRKNLEPSDYKPVVLGLISSDTFNFGPTIRTICDPHAFWRVKPTSSKAFSGRGITRAAIKPSTAANDIQSPGAARFPVI